MIALGLGRLDALPRAQYVNEWIKTNRCLGRVKVTELDRTACWPATNGVVAGKNQ